MPSGKSVLATGHSMDTGMWGGMWGGIQVCEVEHGGKDEPTIGAIGALMNSVLQPRPLVVLGVRACCPFPEGLRFVEIQGYLAHKKPRPPRTLQ